MHFNPLRHGFTTEGMEYKNATAILERLLQNYDKHAIPYIKGEFLFHTYCYSKKVTFKAYD